MKVGYVRPEYVSDTWPYIRGYARKVISYSGGRRTEDGLLNDLINGRSHLWVAYDDERIVGFCTTYFTSYDGIKILSGDVLAGEDFMKWRDQLNDALVFFAKGNGCVGIELTGRSGWERVLKDVGWKKIYTTVELRWDEPGDKQEQASGAADEPNGNPNVDSV